MSKLKSKIVSVLVGVMVSCALVGAQASQTPVKFKKVRQEITLPQDVKVGSTVLKSGVYQVTSTEQGLSFRRLMPDPAYSNGEWVATKDKPVVVKCTVTMLQEKSHSTQLDMPVDGSGVAVLKSVTLDGTDIKFTIDQ